MDMGRGNCSAWLVGLLIGTVIMENCMDILKEIKKNRIMLSINPSLGHVYNEDHCLYFIKANSLWDYS